MVSAFRLALIKSIVFNLLESPKLRGSTVRLDQFPIKPLPCQHDRNRYCGAHFPSIRLVHAKYFRVIVKNIISTNNYLD